MKIKHIIYSFLFVLLILGSSCKKPAGTGGNSTNTGKVWVEDWNSTFTNLNYQYAGVDIEVYIVYGDDINYGDKTNTNGNGEFEFKYLRKGNYKIYAVSKQKQNSSTTPEEIAVSIDVTVSKNKSTLDAGLITIKK